MDKSGEKCFVEQFHLRSPIEEFESYCLSATRHAGDGRPKYDDASHREAVALVLSKLRPPVAAAAIKPVEAGEDR